MPNNLKEYRIKKKLSQAQLAVMVGASRQSISNLERSKQTPSVYMSNKIGEVLGTTSETLFPAQIVNNDEHERSKETSE
ncbi:helix-turn-helix transcriptional regulator [Lentilactobacillus kefiri]|uniref:helix-turn-helix transcriptional regulator n=1 Tax=Lentilactobacillus kefiri TaxID=33962 RepID=UPI0021C430FC|nr:helix-turn-helix domain-containing protein [Lentilactobacillus kefiri]MCP9370119.1 helix-turn-helix domain-containing protein [Lentilactobacillus kefiri]